MRNLVTLATALRLACERIADGTQEYHEANTAEGWAKVFIAAAQSKRTPDEVIRAMPAARQMTDPERVAMEFPGL